MERVVERSLAPTKPIVMEPTAKSLEKELVGFVIIYGRNFVICVMRINATLSRSCLSYDFVSHNMVQRLC